MPSVIRLFDLTGTLAKPWLASHHVYQFDMQLEPRQDERITLINGTADTWKEQLDRLCREEEISIILSQCPCTDLAVSGSLWFKKKFQANPNYRKEAMELVYIARDLGEKYNIPYAIENPVSVLATKWRKPDYSFHPYEYGEYIPDDEAEHPRWPDYIAPKDAYTKKTCLWTSKTFRMPQPKPTQKPDGYSTQHLKLGGKSKRTKDIRSATPRGFATAVYEFNKVEETA